MIPEMIAEVPNAKRLGFPLDLRSVIDTIPALVVCALPDGSVEFVNQSWREFTGSTFEELTSWGWQTVIHPDDLRKFVDEWNAARAAGRPFENEARVRRADGQYHWFSIRKVPLRDQANQIVRWYGTGHDIEGLKRADERLRQDELELRKLIDTIPAHVFVIQPDGTPVYANRQDLEYAGLTLEGIRTGNAATSMFHPDDLKELRAHREERLGAGVPFEVEARIKGKDERYHWFSIRLNPLRDEHGRVVRWYGARTDIDDLKRAEDRLRLVVDTTPALIHTARPDGYLDYFNKPWLEYLGVTLDKVTGWNWTAFVHPEDVEGIVAKWRACLATGEIFEYETRVRRANGEYRWMFHRKVPLRDANGNIVKWYGSSLDIEERKTAEEQIRRNARELQRSEFYLAEGQRLAHMGSWAFDPDGFYYWSPELFRMHGLDPASKPPGVQEYLDCVHPQDRESMANLIKGILAKASPFDATKRIVRPNGEVRYIRWVGAPVVENQNLKKYVGSALDVTGHELLTQELRRREAYLTEAQRLSHTGSFGWKPDTGEIVWSDETYRIFEYDRSVKPTIDSVMQRVHPQDRADFQRVIDGASRGATDFEHTYRLLLPDGRVKHVHVIAHALQHASGNREFVGAVTDITEQRHAEAVIREQEVELREVVDTIPAIVWSARPDGSNAYANSRFVEYCGMPPEQIAGSGWHAATHPGDLERHNAKWLACVASGEPSEDELRFRRADGQYRWHLQRGVPLRDEAGNIVKWYGVLTDIEDRKQAEDKIREKETELRQMLDLTPQHVHVLAADGSLVYTNEVALKYHGLTLDEWKERPFTEWRADEVPFKVFHPDDRERLMGELKNKFLSGSPHETEARLLRHDGKHRWFLFRFNPLRDPQGCVMRWYVAGTDIDDRKQAEERLEHENVALREEIDKTSMFEEIVGTSPGLQRVLSHVSKVAPTDSSVLITGETGTGKELIARAIHRRSHRSAGAFVSVNCAAIPRDLIASELFGHEKGAFTGATQRRLGRFELAGEGTIFLDEVGELPAETQIALLRVLQEHEFERVGGTRSIHSDVRVIAATNRDLEAAIAGGGFRSDLFYRLNVFPIEIPPLRDRREDIPILVEYFIDRFARKAGKSIRGLNKKTLDLLQSYAWPGNIRELQNVIERSVIVCESENFSVDESWLSRQPLAPEPKSPLDLSQKLATQEKEMIEAALRESEGRVFGPSGAAAKLGMPRSTLESKIRSLKINKNRFKT
jgi:PAS domain S-box-containing protein